MSKKRFLPGLAVLAITSMLTLTTPAAFAAEDSTPPSDAPRIIREMTDNVGIKPMWVAPGEHTQYPNTGGSWNYGFWNVKFRSYYTVGKCHGSTVKDGSRRSRSIDTNAGRKSVAELWGINSPWANPHYYFRVC